MVRQYRRSSPRTKHRILIIALVIIVFQTLQFLWFGKTARAAMETTYDRVYATINQVVSREFRRFDGILLELDRFRKEGVESEDSLRSFLESLLDACESGRAEMRLLTYAGYRGEDPRGAPVLLKPAGPRGIGEGEDPWEVPGEVAARLAEGDIILYTAGREDPRDTLLFHARDSSGRVYRVLVGLDIEGFFSSYAAPAAASTLTEYAVEWGLAPPPSPNREDGQTPVPPGKYRFNPLRGLRRTAGGSCPASSTAVYLPRVPATLGGRDSGMPPPAGIPSPWPGTWRSIRVDPSEPGWTGGPPDFLRTARFQIQGMPLERAIEMRLSLYWLSASILLLGIGTAFCLNNLQQDRLERLHTQEREFVASITHELKTPLTIILSAADNLGKGIIPQERLRQYSDLIQEEARRLGRMIDEALTLASMESDSRPLPEPVDIETRKFLEELRGYVDPLAEQAGLRIVWSTDALPETFQGDAKSLKFILNNLAANAVYHAYAGKGAGEIRVTGGRTGSGSLVFTVEDDGRGVSPREARRIFEPFYRDRVSRENQEKGSGLGLYLARKTAVTRGGSLTLESPYRGLDGSQKSGCRFVLTLPWTSEVKHGS